MIDTKDLGKVLLPRLLALITCDDGLDGTDAMPLDTMIPVSSSPSLLAFVLDPGSKIFQNILRKGEFVVNVLPREFQDKVVACSKTYPRGIDKLAESGLNGTSSSMIGSKRAKEAKLWMECRLVNKMKTGENMLLFGEVVRIEADDSIVSGGKVDPVKLGPAIRMSFSELVAEGKG